MSERNDSVIRRTYAWFERRLGFEELVMEGVNHPTPPTSASWLYVFGSGATVLLMLQVVTGILLALVYTPSAGEAWSSLQFLNHDISLGWFLRAIHGWGSDFMVAVVLVHLMQVFLFGAYKYPRELTWIVGVFLLLFTLGMAFTGQVLRFDQDAYWGLGIGASIVSRVPWIGGRLFRASSLSMCLSFPGFCWRPSGFISGWFCVWVSTSGRCLDESSAKLLTIANITS
jgi:ubiquinol-cytochrome c reductase cytochrome b subunit